MKKHSKKSPKLFLDANIFFSATSSISGGSSLLFELADKGKITLHTSKYVLGEAERNIKKKLHEPFFERFFALSEKAIIVGEVKGKKKYKKVLPDKDIPVILSFESSKCDYFVTLDKRLFLDNKKISKDLKDKILNPKTFFQTITN